jgi:hypothetical protein
MILKKTTPLQRRGEVHLTTRFDNAHTASCFPTITYFFSASPIHELDEARITLAIPPFAIGKQCTGVGADRSQPGKFQLFEDRSPEDIQNARAARTSLAGDAYAPWDAGPIKD